jgi:hypothetical protein
MPPTLYIDHSIVTHEASWKPLEDTLQSGKLQLALSLWNLYEIGDATDRAQQDKRLAFLATFRPLWIVERVQIQKQEVRAFLWNEKYGVACPAPQIFTPLLSVVDSYHAGRDTRIGLTPRQWIDGVDFNRINKNKVLAPSALSTLQSADPKVFRKRQQEIFRRWIDNLLPDIGPDEKALSKNQKAELLDYCENHKPQFLKACKSLATEEALTAARVSTPKRKPQKSDGIDLMHAAVALAYCDYFLVRDGFVRVCAEHAAKALNPVQLARVYESAETLKTDLS